MRNALVGQALADHAARRHLGQLDAGGLADKRHGARGTRIDLEHIDHVLAINMLDGELHVHQTDHLERRSHGCRLALDLGHRGSRQRIRRQRASRVTRVHAGLLDMLHHAADEGLARRVAQAVDIAFDGIVEKAVEQNRRVVADLDRLAHVALEIALLVHDLHRTPAQHIARPHHQRVTEGRRLVDRLGLGASRGVGRLTQAQFVQELLETLAVLGRIDHVGAGADDGHAIALQIERQFQGRLTAVLNDHTQGLFFVDDLEHVFKRQGLEVQAIGGVVVGGDGLGVAIDHDGLVAVFTHGQCSVHTAVIKLDALADPVGAAAKYHDLLAIRWTGLTLAALGLVGGVHVGGVGGKFGRAGVHPLVNRPHAQGAPLVTQGGVRGAQLLGQAPVGKSFLLERAQGRRIEVIEALGLQLKFDLHNLLDLHQKPGVYLGQRMHLLDAHALRKSITDVPDTVRARGAEFFFQHLAVLGFLVHAVDAHFQAAQGFLEGLLEGAAHGHDLAHRLHLRGQARVGLRELLEGKARDLGDHVVDRRLKGRRRGTARDLVLELIEGVAHRQLGRDLGNRKTSGLGRQS